MFLECLSNENSLEVKKNQKKRVQMKFFWRWRICYSVFLILASVAALLVHKVLLTRVNLHEECL